MHQPYLVSFFGGGGGGGVGRLMSFEGGGFLLSFAMAGNGFPVDFFSVIFFSL
ncbi:hypothetical protein [Pseudomonas cerasi]